MVNANQVADNEVRESSAPEVQKDQPEVAKDCSETRIQIFKYHTMGFKFR